MLCTALAANNTFTLGGSAADAADDDPTDLAAVLTALLVWGCNPDSGSVVNWYREDGELQRIRPITPLALAVQLGSAVAVQVLLAHGASVNGATRGYMRRTPLHFAADCDDAVCMALLLAGGADEGRKDSEGDTAWSLAGRKTRGLLKPPPGGHWH